MNHIPVTAIVYVIFVIYAVDPFNSFWRNQTLIETIAMRKNVIDRNVIEDIIIESIKSVYPRSMVLTM